MQALWTPNQLAEEAKRRGRKISSRQIRRYCEVGARRDGIDAQNVEGRWLISNSEAQRWLNEWVGADK